MAGTRERKTNKMYHLLAIKCHYFPLRSILQNFIQFRYARLFRINFRRKVFASRPLFLFQIMSALNISRLLSLSLMSLRKLLEMLAWINFVVNKIGRNTLANIVRTNAFKWIRVALVENIHRIFPLHDSVQVLKWWQFIASKIYSFVS